MKILSTKMFLFAVCLLPAVMISNAHAKLVTVQFNGTVDFISSGATGLIDIGNSFSGSYTYETLTPDADASSISGEYIYAIKEMSFFVGDLYFSKGVDPTPSFGTDSILIVNNGFGIDLDLYAAIVPVLDGADVGIFSANNFGFEMSLFDQTGTVYTNDSLPSDLNLASFQNSDPNLQPTLQLMFTNDGKKSTFSSANISSISTVPVPASIWLLGTGLVGLISLTKRKIA